MEGVPALQPDVRPGGPGALGQDPGHPRQQILGRVGPRHPPGEVREDLVGSGPLAVDQPVGQALDPLPYRLERDRHHRRGDDRQGQARPCAVLRQRPDADHDRHVHAGDEDGQRPVDEGLVDDDVDVVEVVPEDGDTDGHGDQGDRPAADGVLQVGGCGARAQDLVDRDLGQHRCHDEPACVDEPFQLLALDGASPAVTEYQRNDGGQAGRDDQRCAGPAQEVEDVPNRPGHADGVAYRRSRRR